MSLTRRDVVAMFLLLAAALFWTAGLYLSGHIPSMTEEAVHTTQETLYPARITAISNGNTQVRKTEWSAQSAGPAETKTMESEDCSEVYEENATADGYAEHTTEEACTEYATEDIYTERSSPSARTGLIFGVFSCGAGMAAAAAAIFVLWQKRPLTGPDGAGVLLALAGFTVRNQGRVTEALSVFFYFLTTLFLLYAVRELWGWLWSRCPARWCVTRRILLHGRSMQLSLLFLAFWLILAALGLAFLLTRPPAAGFIFMLTGLSMAVLSGVCCLYRYGGDLHHFQQQLELFQQGRPIQAKADSFIRAETQLLEVQTRHEEAIRTAVTSERFKVELISNVSHDLRTPLTAILGYGELLEREQLSPTGREQLKRLNQKAGYMRDLVESLFELTKVSSGLVVSKQEQIDLIRLLEQTIGLFDDQLTDAGLQVRRHYETETAPIRSDGGRLHQVFANLLGNAIKYTLSGTRIHLEVKKTADGYTVRMTNTASYEMDFQPEDILQRFVRGDSARSTPGSGLGLAIAQTYTESVGGQFQVRIDADQFNAIVSLPGDVL